MSDNRVIEHTVPANHFDMCKFSCSADLGYQTVKDFLEIDMQKVEARRAGLAEVAARAADDKAQEIAGS